MWSVGWFTWYGQNCHLHSFVLFNDETRKINCKKLKRRCYGASSPHYEAEQITEVVIGLDIFDLGENVHSEAISLASLPVATVQIVPTSYRIRELKYIL